MFYNAVHVTDAAIADIVVERIENCLVFIFDRMIDYTPHQ